MQPKKMTDDEIQSAVSRAIDEAQDFIESEIEPKRTKAQKYFDGKVNLEAEEGRSKVVATKCRDAVRAIKPSLLRVFMATDKPVEYAPRGADDVAAAEQATKYAALKFAENQGFRLLSNAIHDALVKKVGILKAYWEEYDDVDIDEYTGLTDDQFALIAADDDVEILEHTARTEMTVDPMGMEIEATVHDAKISKAQSNGKLCIESIPPEDFFVDDGATTLQDCYICGHRSEMRVGDLVQMGFDFDKVADLGTDDDGDDAEQERRGYVPDEEVSQDPSMKEVTVYEAFMRMDVEGTGIPRLYSFILGGAKKELLSYELCDDLPFAVFEVDPEPHAFFGRSLVDILIEDQDAATSMLRGVLDNVHASNTPGFAFDENTVNVEDMLNNEIGSLKRTQGPPANSIMPIVVPFSAGTTLPALQYFDEVIENKTGVSRASMGLNPDALQSTTATAVQATVAGAEGQTEVIARNLAEGGMKQLFRLILRLTRKHVTAEEFMRLDGKFVPVDPRGWNADMDIIVNVGLGTNRKEERLMALRETLQQQFTIWQSYGPQNGIVTLTQIRNTLADILALSGVFNAERYYQPMDPQTEQMLLQQAAQAQAQPQDPNAGLAMAEIQKAQIAAQAKLQSDHMKEQGRMMQKVAEMQMDAQRINQEDDRKRDAMEQEAILKAAQLLGEYGIRVDDQRLRAMQAAPREQ